MKYIRTKDGIGKVTHEDNKNYRANFGRKYPLISKEDVIKAANTIGELCDEYVVNCSKDYEYSEYYPKVCEDWLLDDYSQADRFTIYGAIWTDKGLIYVAKMNDEGELELL